MIRLKSGRRSPAPKDPRRELIDEKKGAWHKTRAQGGKGGRESRKTQEMTSFGWDPSRNGRD